MPSQVRVFVSHHHSPQEDSFTARVADDLRQAGAVVWVDVANIRDGDFMERINAALASSDWLVLVLTPGSLNSPPVRTEVNAALNLVWQRKMRGVIPLVAAALDGAEVPPTWATLQRYDATKGYQSALASLIGALGIAAAPARASTPPARTAPLPLLGPAPTPAGATPVLHLTPTPLYNLGFRGYAVRGVDFILPPLCPVPEGIFTMGSDSSQDAHTDESERPQYQVPVGNFAISQYPLTVAEYRCAVQAQVVREPPKYANRRNQFADWARQLKNLDHPVVCISLNDLSAYVKWIAQLSGQPWRLPTEAEWEKAARGADARLYPWGNAFDKNKCNTNKSWIGEPSSVGKYPDGASPYGAREMAGNVYEWTTSVFKPYPYLATDGRERGGPEDLYALRGGSFYFAPDYSRAAGRVNATPTNYNSNLGARLAASAWSGW